MKNDGFIVMIVDDDPSARKAAHRLVKSYGFAVETFASAEEYLDSGRLGATACLVLDLQMPGLNGLELQSRLNDWGYRIPTIFITAFSDEGKRLQALEGGALAYLIKPFEGADLVTRIKDVMQRH